MLNFWDFARPLEIDLGKPFPWDPKKVDFFVKIDVFGFIKILWHIVSVYNFKILKFGQKIWFLDPKTDPNFNP